MSPVLPFPALIAAPPPTTDAINDADAREPLPRPLRLNDDRPAGARRFFRAPRSGSELAAAIAEPGIAIGTLYALHAAQGLPFSRVAVVASLLIVALTYPGRDRFSDRPLDALVDIGLSWLALLGLLVLFAYASRSAIEAPMMVLLPWLVLTPLLQFVAVLVGRALQRRHRAQRAALRPAVVIGGGAQGAQAAQALAQHAEQSVRVVGVFDDRSPARLDPRVEAQWLGRLDEAARYVEKLGIKDVYICLPLASQPRVRRLLDELQGTTASLFFVPDLVGVSVVQGRLADVHGVPVVGLCETPFTGINAITKRVSDIVLASAIILVTAPLMLLIALGIKCSSPGRVLFIQRRNGFDGDEIFVYKFRTMRVEESSGVIRQATRNDTRVTPFGRLLRRSSLDELPQFFNVLQGRMSIVGPRPHAVHHNELYRRQIKGYMVRHKARPGITGWAQINGCRGETESVGQMKERAALDLEYLRNWSLGLDLTIMWRTVRLIVRDAKAY
jgi:putative colanic acid biosynthesis UDP-glucose lipid carrier transferase